MVPYGRQDITQADIDAVIEVLHSDFLTQGPKVPAFEQAVANYCHVKHAVAANSATSALHMACMALGVGPGDWVWTTPITFVASANCALYCGANVDFVDIDPLTYNLSTSCLAEKLESASKAGKVPKVLVAVHLAGQACEMDEIRRLSGKYGFSVIEDASHAIGGRYRGKPIGNCNYSDITIFSFHPVKIVTTAEGGMATTNNKDLAQKMALLRSHGITREQDLMTQDSHGPWYYEQIGLGFNYRMTELQAALGLSQLDRIDEYVARRNQIARWYQGNLENLPLTLPRLHKDAISAYHLYVVRLQLERIERSHREVFEFLRSAGVGVNLHYIPIPRQPHFARLGHSMRGLPEAERYYAEVISLPMFPTITSDQLKQTISALKAALS